MYHINVSYIIMLPFFCFCRQTVKSFQMAGNRENKDKRKSKERVALRVSVGNID